MATKKCDESDKMLRWFMWHKIDSKLIYLRMDMFMCVLPENNSHHALIGKQKVGAAVYNW